MSLPRSDRHFATSPLFTNWGREYASIAAFARGYSSAGVPLPEGQASYLGGRLGADFSRVRVHCDETSAQLTNRLGTAAFACGERLFFHPAQYQPGSSQTLGLLGHELAHTIQQRGGVSRSSRVNLNRLIQLENEANAAADAVLAGHSFAIEPQLDSPELLPALPVLAWVLMAAVGAAAGTYAVSSNSETVQQDIAKDRDSTKEHLHEKWQYAIIPGVGSFDQMMNGRTAASRSLGAAFLVADVATLGTAKAVIVALNSVGKKAVAKGLAKAGGKELDLAAEQMVKAGTQFLTKEEGAKQLTKVLAGNAGKPLVITTAEGKLNHAVTYIIQGDDIWKIHGGVLNLFFKTSGKQALSEAPDIAAKLVSKSNHISIYTENMLKSGGPQKAIEYFQKAQASSAVTNFFKAPGCGGTQVMLLSQAGIKAGGQGSRFVAPVFPIQMLKTQGAHMILNPTMARVGTGIQAGLWSGVQGVGKVMQYGNNLDNYSEAMNEKYRSPNAAPGAKKLGAGNLIQNLNGPAPGLLGHSGFGYDLDAYKRDPSNLLDLNAFMQNEADSSSMTIEKISAEDFAAAMGQGVETVTSDWTIDGQKNLKFPK